jgi:MFS family permease
LARNGSFLLLWSGQFISQMGDRLAMVAFPWLVYERTGSALSTGVIFALYTLPYLLFGTFAGAVIDRFNKRTVMVVADLLRVGLVLLVPVAAGWSLPAVFVLSFAMASAGVFFDPCKLAILPDIVGPDRLLRANSLLASGENLTEILGFALAGVALARVSTTAAFRADAATFLVSACALAAMRYRAPLRAAATRQTESFARQIREGLSFLRHHRGLLVNTVMVIASAAGLGAAYPLTFLFAVRVLNGGTQAFGVIEAFFGVGYFAGSLTLAVFAARVHKGHAMTLGLAAMGVSLVIVAAAANVWQTCLVYTVLGFANAAALIAVDTYLQQVVPEYLRGRVLGTRFTLTQGTFAAAVIVAGALAGVFDVRVLFVVAGALVTVPALTGLVFFREIREA